ncbi:MAG: hypothetical protein ACYDCC_03025 [Actinomycetota bacterium]
MSHFDCLQVNALAAELALNIASGDDRAHALSHLSSCVECRALVEEMSRTADSLLLLAPQVEPPIGFESRVIARVSPRRRKPSWKMVALAAAIACVFSAITGFTVYGADSSSRLQAHQYQSLVRALGGKTLRAAELHAPNGNVVGKVYAYQGHPSWVFVVLQDRDGNGNYQVELDPVSGESIKLAGFSIKAGEASWATTAALDINDIQSVNIVDSTGTSLYGATFQKSSH